MTSSRASSQDSVSGSEAPRGGSGRPRRFRLGRLLVGVFGLLGALVALIVATAWEALGRLPTATDRARFATSTQFQDGRFVNPLPRQMTGMIPLLRRWFFEETPNAAPTVLPPVEHRTAADFATIPPEGRVTWLGHSTLLIELEGLRMLIDPVWGERASPSSLFGVSRFYAPPLAWEDLPVLDAVIISHDHYDHLDHTTIRRFAERGEPPRFIVPLGVGARLQGWGIPADRITELDWWDEATVGTLRIVATPSRHFSGRAPWDEDRTLWAGWALIGTERRLFYSGDTAMSPHFAAIGERLGPFDLTLIEIGAYDADWPDVHLGPEQAVAAHQMVRGDVLLPVHWGLFALAFHSWTEPIERALVAAAAHGVTVVTPVPGGSVDLSGAALSSPSSRWWPELPWHTAEERPVRSTGMGGGGVRGG